MNDTQHDALCAMLLCLSPLEEFHHGDCVGVDADAHAIVDDLIPRVFIIVHPPTDPRLRAFCMPTIGDILAPLPYLDRNKAIVEAVDLLIAVPNTATEELRSGTWQTIRYATGRCQTTRIIMPSGKVLTR